MLIKKPTALASSPPDTPADALTSLKQALSSGSIEECIHWMSQFRDLPSDARPWVVHRLGAETDVRLQQALLNHLIPGLTAEELPTLLTMLDSEQAALRNQVIDALAQLRNSDLSETLAQALRQRLLSPVSDQRVLTLNLIGLLGWQTFGPVIGRLLLEDSDLNVCMTAVDTLLVLDAHQQWPLIEQLNQRFPDDEFVGFTIEQVRRCMS